MTTRRPPTLAEAAAVPDDAEPKAITVLHVIGPLGDKTCPKCKSVENVDRRGSWEWGPFYWECDECGETWGFA